MQYLFCIQLSKTTAIKEEIKGGGGGKTNFGKTAPPIAWKYFLQYVKANITVTAFCGAPFMKTFKWKNWKAHVNVNLNMWLYSFLLYEVAA